MYDLDFLTRFPEGEQHRVERPDGTSLFCIVTGDADGPLVVLAHGYLGSLTGFNIVTEALVSRGYRVLLFDQRGHGESSLGEDGMGLRPMADDYRAVLEHIDAKDALLIGHSMGAFLSLGFCLQHSDAARAHLRAMVLVGAHAGDVARGSLPNRLQIPLLRRGLLTPLMKRRFTGRFFARNLFGEQAGANFVEATYRNMRDANVPASIPILEDMVERDLYPRLGEIAIETRVICGEVDNTCPRWHSERLGDELPSADNIWLRGVGHMVIYERPEAIVDAVDSLADASSTAAPSATPPGRAP